MRFQAIAARIAFGGFVIAWLVALAASSGTRLGWWDLQTGLLVLLPAIAAGAIGFLAGIAWVWSALARNESTGARWGVIGLIGSVIAIGIPLNDARLAFLSPPIHDISSDIEYAPEFKSLLPLRAGAPNGPEYDGPKTVVYDGKKTTVSALQKKYYEDVIPFIVFGKPLAIFWRGLNAANEMGWHVVSFDPRTLRIEATESSFWFGLTDDIVIRVKPAGRLGARLDIRSKSRVGENDMGGNATRIRAYIKLLKEMASR
jgi:hypothetical protein